MTYKAIILGLGSPSIIFVSGVEITYLIKKRRIEAMEIHLKHIDDCPSVELKQARSEEGENPSKSVINIAPALPIIEPSATPENHKSTEATPIKASFHNQNLLDIEENFDNESLIFYLLKDCSNTNFSITRTRYQENVLDDEQLSWNSLSNSDICTIVKFEKAKGNDIENLQQVDNQIHKDLRSSCLVLVNQLINNSMYESLEDLKDEKSHKRYLLKLQRRWSSVNSNEICESLKTI